jgi:ribonuclease J
MGRKKEKAYQFEQGKLYALPVGGCGQFGANMTLYGLNGSWIAVDCGTAFADHRYPGVDLMMPDLSSLPQAIKENIDALIITHAHEDHIGGVGYLWPELGYPPIFSSLFASKVLHKKMAEHMHRYDHKPSIQIFGLDDVIKPSPMFEVLPLPVSHSIPEAHSLCILPGSDELAGAQDQDKAPAIIHSGDWNCDDTPIVGYKTEEKIFRQIADEYDIWAYFGDSTNAGSGGESKSESYAAAGLKDAFLMCEGKIVITIFSSNIGRVKSICQAAKASGRRVCVEGRSLKNMVSIAGECGYLDDVEALVMPEDMGHFPDHEQVYIVTGSQGEGRAALGKIAYGMHRHITLGKGDTVFFSARKIPGNERAINDIMNLFIDDGVHVITPDEAPIHVSGHPQAGEIDAMLEWLDPRHVIAVHGERAQMRAQEKLAQQRQFKTCPARNGALIELCADQAIAIDHFACELRPVVFDEVVEEGYQPLRDRKKISFNGCVFASAYIDTGAEKVEDLSLSVIGLLDLDRATHEGYYDELMDQAEQSLYDALSKGRGDVARDDLEEAVRISIRRYFKSLWKIKPIVEVHIIMD